MAQLDDLRIDAPPPRPRHRRPSLLTPMLVILTLAALGWMLRDQLPALHLPGLGQPPTPAAPLAAPAAADPTATGSTGSTAAAPPAPAGSFSAGGYIEVNPPGPRVISTLVAGKVEKLHVAPGEPVHKGQLVAELNSELWRQQASVLQARVDLAQSQLKLKRAGFRDEELLDAQAGVDRAQARLQWAQADAARSSQLFQAGVVARSDYDATQSELAQAQADVKGAQSLLDLRHKGTRQEDIGIALSEVKVAQAELAQLRFNIAQCLVKAPADGVVYDVFVSAGSWVDPADGTAHQGQLLSSFDPRQIQAYADVNQRDSARITLGQPVELFTDAQPTRAVRGEVSLIMPQANLQKNTVRVKIRLLAPPVDLKPEMNVKVNFLAPVGAADGQASEIEEQSGRRPASPGKEGATP